MNKLVKYVALLSIVFTAGLAFVNSFVPEYDKWREKYPQEPDPEDDEDETPNGVSTQSAEELFKQGQLTEKGE